MHGLTTHTQRLGNDLPTPALFPCVCDVQGLQLLLQALQCADGTEADRWVGTAQFRCQIGDITHSVNLG